MKFRIGDTFELDTDPNIPNQKIVIVGIDWEYNIVYLEGTEPWYLENEYSWTFGSIANLLNMKILERIERPVKFETREKYERFRDKTKSKDWR